MNQSDQIQEAYMDYVLTHGKEPNSVYIFCKEIGLKESEFYSVYNSFPAVGLAIWNSFFVQTREMIEKQEVWAGYTIRERFLSFFYSYCELLKSFRSYVSYSLKQGMNNLKSPEVLTTVKRSFFTFCDELITEGLDTGELIDRKFLTDRYKDGLWMQFVFIVRFWIQDNSPDFEKTDEAIEKGVNLSFDLMARSPLDSLVEYSKFLIRNGSILYERTK